MNEVNMIMIKSSDSKIENPWYRQFWPWFLILLPASAVIAGFFTLYLAMQAPDRIIKGEYETLGKTITLPSKKSPDNP